MLLSAVILGLMGSFHCVGMCGPIAFMLPVDHNKPARKLFQVFLYHIGRLTSYSLIGLIFGFLGKGLYVFGLQQRLSIIIGVLMIVIILIPYKTFGKYNFSKPIYSFLTKIKSRLGKELQKKSPDTFLTIGFLNGLLPCGLVYMAVFGSIATANPWLGALFMALFGLGTIPLMTTAVYFGSMLKGSAKKSVQRLIPVFVILVGLLFILRGMGLGIPYISPAPVMQVVDSTLECH
ncbi:sulfite exporter TauE/SafE family protein [Arenibacter algicola]|jgi:sulfite exporter TauE/SafE|uniref:Cytochrome C biogenesis protein transmembrane region n=1 Tax=Arenibacter algicola TaxID=616991 RepID=A0A221UWN3_9FLAO|nr:sulfite exporter TauE/SafE family protein [Arenibacter algicola]ASO05578.1 cytochrome C biogenesis protein transmembrane region [Arenibacter algicola]